jgi:hypothetical protein
MKLPLNKNAKASANAKKSTDKKTSSIGSTPTWFKWSFGAFVCVALGMIGNFFWQNAPMLGVKSAALPAATTLKSPTTQNTVIDAPVTLKLDTNLTIKASPAQSNKK